MEVEYTVLVFRSGQLGDALISLAAVRSILRGANAVKLDLLYDQHIGKCYVLSGDLFADGEPFRMRIPYVVGYSFSEKVRALFGLVRLWFRLRSVRYDLIINLEPEGKSPARSLRDLWYFQSTGCKRYIRCLPHRKPRSQRRPLVAFEHESDFFLRVLREEGFTVPEAGSGDMALGLTEADESRFATWWGTQTVPQRRLVGVGLGSKMQSKRWPVERFEAVLRQLIVEFSVWPVFFGGPEDKEVSESLIASLGAGSNACGLLDLRASAVGLGRCDFYLGNDTGTMHLAVSAGTQCVAIFSARDVPGKWYPYGKGHFVLRIPVDCEGCMLYECIEQKRKCLMGITEEAVLESCRQMLTRKHHDVPLVEVTDTGRRDFYPVVVDDKVGSA